MKNLKERIAILEIKHSDPLIDAIHDLACKFGQDQGRLQSERPSDVVNALELLADYLPN